LVPAVPVRPEVLGLLALMLLTHARSAARFTHTGEIVLLDRQDRSLWDRDAITERASAYRQSDASWKAGPYQVQAAITALALRSPRRGKHDWKQIALFVRDARTHAALARSDGQPRRRRCKRQPTRAGSVLLDAVAGRRELRGYPEFYSGSRRAP